MKIETNKILYVKATYELNGAIYLSDTKTLLEKKSFYHKNTYPYVMPMERSVNINNKIDLRNAEFFIAKGKKIE